MQSPDPVRRSFLLLLIAFLVLTAAIGTIGYRNYLDQRSAIEMEVRRQLLAVADMKLAQVVEWRDERSADARMVEASAILPTIQHVLAGRADAREEAQAANWLKSLGDGGGYANAILINAQGRVCLTAGTVAKSTAHYGELMEGLLAAGKVAFSDIHYDTGLSGPHMGLHIPLRPGPDSRIRGAVLLGIDPAKFLYPLIQAWPTPSGSAETLLVRRDGNEVVFLNELRHQRNTSLRLRLPLSRRDVLAVKAVQGREGLADGVDYRGVPVLGALRKIPDSPWWLVAKVDAQEVYAPVHQQAVWLALLCASLVLTIGACGGIVWRHLRASLDRERLEETRRAEDTLKRSEERFRSVVENAPEGIVVHTNAVIRYANPAAVSILGAGQAEELLGRSLMGYVHPSYHSAVEERIRLSHQSGVPSPLMEQEWITADGKLVDVEVSAVPFVHEQQNGALVFFHDVTERKRAEEARRRTQALLQSVMEGTSDAVYVKDEEGRYLLANSSVTRAMGRPVEEIIGRDDLSLWPPGVGEQIRAVDQAIMKERRTVTVEERVTLHDGSTATFFSAKGPMIDDRGNVVGLFGISRDVTEKNRIEQERARLQEQLQQSQKIESVGRLAGGVAHDFNNLLTVINGYASMLLGEVRQESAIHGALVEIEKAGSRAAELTRQLLAFSRKQLIEPKVLDLNRVVEDVTKMLRRLLGEDILVSTVLAPGLGRVLADSGQMHQLLMNLAVNARDAMPDGGKFIIETENVEVDAGYVAAHAESRPGSYVQLTVTDDGVGMDQETRQRAFEPFFTTKAIGEGTGLGLSMVYGIVKQNEGWISLYSEPGRGTTFRIYLPRVDRPEVPFSDESSAASLNGKETVLVVEDQDDVRKLTCAVLTRFGYKVLHAANGHEALQLCQRHDGKLDLLLTDVVMPEMTGRDLADRIVGLRPGIRVVYMSGYTGNLMAQKEVLESGAAYISKPFSPQGLATKLREVLAN
jgi:two-component system cell cycle sensor histidine kinase/response regulator CckA